ncbi:MAG TPA: PIG-L family deacetylase [Gemmatimonadales bacterium]|nr:PIG-L family deacetylase [Gemmatimonadales bacterium]
MRRASPLSLALIIAIASAGQGQLAPAGTGGIASLVNDLNALGANKRVLVIGAHPDDEDNDVLALFARGLGVQTAYLSLSRGEGGQNFIGPELGPALGVIRSEELLAARRVDGARQFFTRAYDFGFSKSADETFRFWPRDSLVTDMIAVIRAFRPQIIISVFSGTPADGHGQHQVAGMLSRQVFEMLKDSSWGPVKLYRSTRFDTADTQLSYDAGQLDPVLGRSYHQLAVESRSQHRSQEMGRLEQPGPAPVRLALWEARQRGGTGAAPDALFSGIDTTFAGLGSYAAEIDSARALLNPLHPDLVVPLLARALAALDAGTRPQAVVPLPLVEQHDILERALATAAGIAIDAAADDWIVVPGQAIAVDATIWNTGAADVRVEDVQLVSPDGWAVRSVAPAAASVAPHALATARFALEVPENAPLSQPYFLRRPLVGALYDWTDAPPGSRGLPFEPPPARLEVRVRITGAPPITIRREVSERFRDPALGEVRRPLLVDCAFDLALTPDVLVWPIDSSNAGAARRFTVTVTNRTRGAATARVTATAPRGWPEPSGGARVLTFTREDESQSFEFRLTPPGGAATGSADVEAAVTAVDAGGRRCSDGLEVIDYPHIRRRSIVHAATSRIRLARITLPRLARVGYVRGAADRVPEALASAGVPIVLIDAEALARGDLSRYDAIVIGSRAYGTEPALVANNGRILDYARRGGLVIVQYQENPFAQGGYAPYPLTMTRPADRVTDEAAPVTFFDPTARVLHVPNALGAGDWRGWVQDRGLYFAHSWDKAYATVLAMHDPGEPPLPGGLLIAKVGKGTWVYTGLAFFRQLPAGVPGAFRLFANLLALNQ